MGNSELPTPTRRVRIVLCSAVVAVAAALPGTGLAADWTSAIAEPTADWTSSLPTADWTSSLPTADWTSAKRPAADWTSAKLPAADWTSKLRRNADWTSAKRPTADWTSRFKAASLR